MDKYCNCTSSLTGYWGPKGNHNGRSSALFGANVRGISTDETYFSTTWKKGEEDYEKGNNNKKRNTSIDFFFFSSTGNYKLQLREKDYYFLGEHRLLFLSQASLQKFTRKRDRNGEEIYIYVCMEHGESFVVISKCQFYFTSFILYVCLHEEIYCRLWELIVDGIMNQRTGVCRWINQVQTHRV